MKNESSADTMFSMHTQADFATVSYWKNRPEQYHGMSYAADYSDERTAVYAGDGLYEISFRGSVDHKDWLQSNVASQRGQQSQDPRFIKDRQLFKQIRSDHPDDQIYLPGHSLGGARAYEIARDYADVGASIFNPEVSTNHLEDWKSDDPAFDNIISYRTPTDLASSLVSYEGGKHVTVPTKATVWHQRDAHKMSNFRKPKST